MSRKGTRAPLHPAALLAITAGLTALGSLAIHMFVPAMPAAAAELGASPSGIQLALTLYFGALAISQFVAGPITEAVGRRPLVIASALLFVLGSVMAWAAPNLIVLLAGRVIQAAGGASGLVASRAMAADKGGASGARDMALLMAIVMLSPMLGPVLGAFLTASIGWHSIFAALAIAGLVIGGCAMFWLPETMHAAPAPFTLSGTARAWRGLLADRRFVRNLLIGCCMTASLTIFLTAAPFLLLKLEVAETRLGLCFALVAAAATVGALLASWLAGRVRPELLVRITAWPMAAAAILFAILAASGEAGASTLLAVMAFHGFGTGMIAPTVLNGAVAAGGGRGGLVASAYGSIQMAGNALAGAAAVALPSGSLAAFALAFAAISACAALLATTRPS